jgi:hypothetical protein
VAYDDGPRSDGSWVRVAGALVEPRGKGLVYGRGGRREVSLHRRAAAPPR